MDVVTLFSDLNLWLLILIAGVVAVIVRKKDTPSEPIRDLVSALTTFGYAIIADVIAVIISDSQGILLAGFAGLVILVGAAVGGMAFIRTALNLGEELKKTKTIG